MTDYLIKGVLQAATLAEAVRRAPWTLMAGTRSEVHPIDIKPFERTYELYHYQDGVWRPGGDRIIRRRIARLLGEDYRIGFSNIVIDIVQHGEDALQDDPLDNLVNCRNGLLDWRSGNLLDHNPATPSRIQIPTSYDPAATCPKFTEWLHQVVDDDCVDLVFEIIGYCLLNANPFHKAFLIYGPGRNGKGTLLRTIAKLLGTDNVCSISPQALDDDRWATADMFDKLANLAGDVSPRAFAATENFKKATGGDMLRAERKFGQPFQFEARATTLAAYNELPTTTDTTDGFFSRWIVLPMDRGYFPAGAADPNIEKTIQTPGELSGILAMAVLALRGVFHRGGFSQPATAAAAKAEFEVYAHPVRAFATEFIDGILADIDDKFVSRPQVYEAYKAWAGENGHGVLAARRFYADFEAIRDMPFAIAERTNKGNRGYRFERLAVAA